MGWLVADTTKPQVVRGRVRRGRHAGRGPVARTVRRVAQKGTAALAAGVGCGGHPRIFWRPRRASFVVRELIVLVGAPLPDIPGHVKESVAVGGELSHGSCPGIPVGFGVDRWERALPYVGMLRCNCIVAPHVPGTGLATSSGRFPFVFGGESFARPLGVGGRVVPRHVDHRMVHAVLNGTLWAFRVTPTRAGDPAPPIGEGGDGGAFGWGGEDH